MAKIHLFHFITFSHVCQETIQHSKVYKAQKQQRKRLCGAFMHFLFLLRFPCHIYSSRLYKQPGRTLQFNRSLPARHFLFLLYSYMAIKQSTEISLIQRIIFFRFFQKSILQLLSALMNTGILSSGASTFTVCPPS